MSASFLSSHYCYSIEMQRALERHARGECKVVPVILRACDWKHSPLGKLLAVPQDGKPITSWTNLDEAYTDVVRQIRALVQGMARRDVGATVQSRPQATVTPSAHGSATSFDSVRSSNLRLRKSFTDYDKDQFAHSAFDYIRRFFENSLAELEARNPSIQGALRQVSDVRFTASIYREGKVVSECAIVIGGSFDRNGITYSAQISRDGYNEALSLEADDQTIYFKTLMGRHGAGRGGKLSQEGAAELYWSQLLEPLQR